MPANISALNLKVDQLLRTNPCFLFSQYPLCPQWCDHSRTRELRSANTTWEELTIHQIMAITAFPFHWDTSRDTHTHEDSLLYLQGMPSFILQPWFKEANEHRLSTSILWEGSSIHPPILRWNPMYSPKAKPTVSQYTHHSSLAVSPLCACSPRCGTQTVKSPVPPLHTMPSSKGGWRGM